jgi:hypothetical protein
MPWMGHAKGAEIMGYGDASIMLSHLDVGLTMLRESCAQPQSHQPTSGINPQTYLVRNQAFVSGQAHRGIRVMVAEM